MGAKSGWVHQGRAFLLLWRSESIQAPLLCVSKLGGVTESENAFAPAMLPCATVRFLKVWLKTIYIKIVGQGFSYINQSRARHGTFSHIDTIQIFPKKHLWRATKSGVLGKGKICPIAVLNIAKDSSVGAISHQDSLKWKRIRREKCISLVSSWGQHFWWSIKHIRNSTLSHKFFLPIKYKASLWH